MYPGCTITCSPLGERIGERIITASGETLATFAKELNVEGVVTLCETHYQTMYREVHKLHQCAGCGAKSKVREGAYTRHSPNAAIVSEYLHTRIGSDPTFTY